MRTARALFVAEYRISHAVLGLKFDKYLQPAFDKTYIFTHSVVERVDAIFKKHGIDTANFVYVEDKEMISKYPTINNWWFDKDPRGSWLFQQALKLASLDYIDADVTLIQDPDTFCIAPYNYVNGSTPNYFILPNESHARGYYDVLQNCLGIARQTPHCFVTEFMPVLKDDWLSLKHHIEHRNNKDCFDSIIESVPVSNYDRLRWFSEYEFLGNWVMTQRPIDTTVQTRFQYKTMGELDNLTADYNCVCDQIPLLKDSIVLDERTDTVIDLDKVIAKLEKFL